MKNLTHILLWFAMLACAMTIGCSTSEPGVSNTMGTLSTSVNANPPQAANAAEAALRELELIRVHRKSTDLDGQVFGYTASDTKVSVHIKKSGENLSKLSVRVGTFGDQDLGLAVIKKIESRLSTLEAKQSPAHHDHHTGNSHHAGR